MQYWSVPAMLTPNQRRDIRIHAEDVLLRHRQADTPETLRRIAEEQGIEILEADLHDISGALRKEESRWRIYVNRDDSPARQLFTIAHELGHYFLHGRLREDFVDGDLVMNRDENDKWDMEELEANEFAGNLVMPAPRIERVLGARTPTEREVLQLADAFQVSPLAMVIRLRTLGYAVPSPARA
jgi:Zn-dependent peptidase ImmA (M78 family)